MKSTDNPNEPTNNGVTPIFIDAQNNNFEVVQLLMNETDHPNQPRNNDGATPIHIAAENNHIELVKLLMKSTGNPNQPRNDVCIF